ncbi:MAG TPA: hypothetical protein PLC12_03045, partial [Candidatus Methanofastidiosa archaeon]|nr:hypothetical protein [Candidatus Methanofastidiosa archaeon]
MKKILPLMVLLCLFGSFAVPISANDEDPGLTTMIDVERDSCPDDLVMPEEWGEVVILANPEIELYEDEIQKD